MSVCSVFFLEELATAQWVKNNGKLSMQEFTGLVYRYSRELEHSDENLITMDQMMEEI
jgi:lysine-N-methylase